MKRRVISLLLLLAMLLSFAPVRAVAANTKQLKKMVHTRFGYVDTYYFTFNSSNRLSSIKRVLDGGYTSTMYASYDSAGRCLEDISGRNKYEYDSKGRLKVRTSALSEGIWGVTTYYYDSNGALYKSDGYSHDAAGNVLTDWVTWYECDSNNRVIKEINNTEHSVAYYYYDGQGRIKEIKYAYNDQMSDIYVEYDYENYKPFAARITHNGYYDGSVGLELHDAVGTVVWEVGDTLGTANYYQLIPSVDSDGYVSRVTVSENNHTWEFFYEAIPESAKTIASGWSGYTQWTLTDDGVLKVYGNGSMKNYGYSDTRPWEKYSSQIKTVVIEKGVTAVGECAFKGMTKVQSVTLPTSGLSKIGEAAFYGCTSLKEIDIPDTVYTVFDYTFKNCASLEKVRLSKILIKVGQGAFENCTALDYIYIPGDVEIIGSWSFKGCTDLAEVDMTWADATEIREGAFKNCSSLTTVLFPGGIKKLGDSAFYGIGAASFTVPSTVTEVGPWCFARAYSMRSITFKGNAPKIGEGAFNKITLTAYYPRNNSTWTSSVRQNYGGTVTWKAN